MNVGFIQLSTSPFISICWLHSIVWKWTLPVEWWTRTYWMVLWSRKWRGVVSGVDKSRCECHFTTVGILTLREDEMSFISVIIERYSVASLIVQHLFSIILFESFLCVVIARSQLQMLMNTVLSFIVHSSDGNSINVNWMRLNKCEHDHVVCCVLSCQTSLSLHISHNPFHFSPQFVHDLKNGSTKSDNRMDDSEVPTESSREHLDSKVLLMVVVVVVVVAVLVIGQQSKLCTYHLNI